MKTRVRKRSSKACQRCQRYKIKCSGSQPCETCNKRNLACVIDGRAQKVLVSQGFIDDLQRKVALLEQCNDLSSPHAISDNLNDGDRQPSGGTSETVERSLSPELTNPLSTGPSTFISTNFGRTFYLGTSSNWSFARKVLNMVHEQVHASPLPTEMRHFDETAYEINWNGLRGVPSLDIPITPALDFSKYLLNAVKFHAGQLFHLFDELSFTDGLHAYYANPIQQRTAHPLWYVQFLLLLAFGKAYVSQKRPDHHKLPGYEFFAPALQLLPDSIYLYRYPLEATEVLCCVALYLHSLDYRSPAYGFIGQAVRLSLASGMHTDMPMHHLGEEALQRRRRIWWTVYILDRHITSLQGLPQAVDDAQIHHELPHYPGNPQKVNTLRFQIQMCQIIADIDRTVYGINGRLNQGFLSSTKTALENTADLGVTLRDTCPLDLDDDSINGVSRLSASLHLLYHQCIVLATRPLVFCFLKMRYQSVDSNTKPLTSSVIAWKLLKVCIESAKQMLNILMVVQKQSLLDSFLPFDLESTFMSALVVLTAPSIDPCLLEDPQPWLDKAYEVLEEMVYRGNTVARFRRTELDQLRELLKQPSLASFPDATDSSMPPVLSLDSEDGLEATDIMTLAGLIDTRDVDWIAHTLTENSIW